jgi:hypothetical protein
MTNNMATELLHEIKKQCKRWFIACLVFAGMFFISNALWLYAWCLPTDETSEECTISSTSGNAIYNNSGEVSANVGNCNSKEN